MLRRERKRRIEAADAYRAGGAEDRAAAEEAEAVVIDEFLPASLDEDEIAAIVEQAIAETGATLAARRGHRDARGDGEDGRARRWPGGAGGGAGAAAGRLRFPTGAGVVGILRVGG